jgi:hypothetical protein
MRDILTSPRIEDMKRKQRAKRRRFLMLLGVLLLVLIVGLAYLSSIPRLQIKTVVVEGTRIINSNEVEEKVQENLKGKYLYLFSRSNSLIYPHSKIYNDLLVSFPRTETLKVSRLNLNALKVTITERAGSFLYCGPTIPEIEMDVGENCYFINNDGYIFDKAPYFSGNLYFKYYVKIENEANPLSSQMLPIDRFHELARFIDKITALGFKPIYITIEDDGSHTLYLDHVPSDTTPKIIFRQENDLTTIYDNLATSMSQKQFADEIKNKYTKLLYIDLRFRNKVLYKFNE